LTICQTWLYNMAMEPEEYPENQNHVEQDDDAGRVEAAKRDILTRVARGRLSPDQAADELSRLDRLGAAALVGDRASPPAPPPGDASGWDGRPSEPAGAAAGSGAGASSAASGSGSATSTATASAPPSESVRCVRVVGAFRALRVVGDPDVREAVAEGPHRVRREGDALLIESEPADMFPGSYSFGDWRRQRGWSGRGGPGPGPFGGFGGVGGFGGLAAVPVTVRMHPDIALDADLHAGSLSVRGVRAPIRAHVAAGTVRVEGVAAPVDISVAAGTVAVSGVLDRGQSKIECDAGKVRVNLERGSSVKVKARAEVGRVDVPGTDAGATEWLLGGGHESTVGSGSGELSIRVSMGAVQVFAEP